MIVDPATAPVSGENGLATLHLSVAGGLTHFGAYVDTLQPGAYSSHRHWHENEDEFLYVLDGTATVRDDDGAHDLGPGDAVCWRHGDPNAHHVTNLGDVPCRYLIVGSRVAGDVCHYPDSGRRLVNGAARWVIYTATGEIEREGELPPELVGLPPVWGQPYDGTVRPRILRAAEREWVAETAYMHPILGGGLGPYQHCVLGDAGGLSQFGVHLEILPPGSRSSFRHWHEAEDEMVHVLSGEVVLVEDTGSILRPGDTACWPAGHPVGHCLENRNNQNVIYLAIGTRCTRDVIRYPDHELVTIRDGNQREYRDFHGRSRTIEKDTGCPQKSSSATSTTSEPQ